MYNIIEELKSHNIEPKKLSDGVTKISVENIIQIMLQDGFELLERDNCVEGIVFHHPASFVRQDIIYGVYYEGGKRALKIGTETEVDDWAGKFCELIEIGDDYYYKYKGKRIYAKRVREAG